MTQEQQGGKKNKKKNTHLVDELEAILVHLAVVLQLDGVEGEGGGSGEGDNAGGEEGHRLLEERGGGRERERREMIVGRSRRECE